MKNYRATFKGKLIVLTPEEWKLVRERFDVKSAVDEGDEYVIRISCFLCEKYVSLSCRGCTFNKFRLPSKVSGGCVRVMESLVGAGDGKHTAIEIRESKISWNKELDKQGRAEVMKIHKALSGMKLS
jgi:hypothetical protein